MQKVYEYRNFPKPPVGGIRPLSHEWQIYNGEQLPPKEQQALGDSQVCPVSFIHV